MKRKRKLDDMFFLSIDERARASKGSINASGCIMPNSDFAKTIGFTTDKFDGYLWKDSKSIVITVIISLQPGQGHLTQLFRNIQSAGFNIKVPTPLGKMRLILTRYGFEKTEELNHDNDTVEVWFKSKDNKI